MTEEKYCKYSTNPQVCVGCEVGIGVRNKIILRGHPDPTEYWKVFCLSNCGEIISRNCERSIKYIRPI